MATASERYFPPEEIRGTILERIVSDRLPEIASAKSKLPAESIMTALDRAPEVRSLKHRLLRQAGIIAEIKRASPSAGLFREDFDPARIAVELEQAGAAAISVLTEANYFRGGLETLAALRWHVFVPLLRKDFIVDGYQILEARLAGADAVLLIAALLDQAQISHLRGVAEELRMDALVEVHSEAELERTLNARSTFVGVNSRDLRSFEVSLDTCRRLAPMFPRDVVAVAESGLRTVEDIRSLQQLGYRGFLIGGTLMRAKSPGEELSRLVEACGKS